MLHHALVTAPGAPAPDRWIFVLHGIFGSGANWRSFARRLSGDHPQWGFVLVDLRAHGQSLPGSPPHTLAAAADDVRRLERDLGLPVRGAIGHSFGGKVMLACLEARARDDGPSLDHAWLLDSSPSAGSPRGASIDVLALLEGMPANFSSRADFVERVRAAGHSKEIAEWLAMNVRPVDGGFRFRVDLGVVRALLEDYFARDLWSVVERHEGTSALHVVLGGRSDAISAADRERFSDLAARASGRLTLEVLEQAGHWVHADDPEGLARIIGARLRLE